MPLVRGASKIKSAQNVPASHDANYFTTHSLTIRLQKRWHDCLWCMYRQNMLFSKFLSIYIVLPSLCSPLVTD